MNIDNTPVNNTPPPASAKPGGTPPVGRRLMPMILPIALIAVMLLVFLLPKGNSSSSTSLGGTYNYVSISVNDKLISMNVPAASPSEAYRSDVLAKLQARDFFKEKTITDADVITFFDGLFPMIRAASGVTFQIKSDKISIAQLPGNYFYQVPYAVVNNTIVFSNAWEYEFEQDLSDFALTYKSSRIYNNDTIVVDTVTYNIALGYKKK